MGGSMTSGFFFLVFVQSKSFYRAHVPPLCGLILHLYQNRVLCRGLSLINLLDHRNLLIYEVSCMGDEHRCCPSALSLGAQSPGPTNISRHINNCTKNKIKIDNPRPFNARERERITLPWHKWWLNYRVPTTKRARKSLRSLICTLKTSRPRTTP